MKVSGMLGADLEMAPLAIAELEQRGFDTAFTAEINSDPYFPLVLAAEHSERIALTTSISVAFARNPMNVAQMAWDPKRDTAFERLDASHLFAPSTTRLALRRGVGTRLPHRPGGRI